MTQLGQQALGQAVSLLSTLCWTVFYTVVHSQHALSSSLAQQ